MTAERSTAEHGPSGGGRKLERRRLNPEPAAPRPLVGEPSADLHYPPIPRAVRGEEQCPFLLRAVYCILIGWWFSGLWMAAAYVALISIVGIPLAFWMYGRIGALTTLFRSEGS